MKDDIYFQLEKKANYLRKMTLEMCINAGTGHVTSCMSCADIIAVLYYGRNIMKQNPKNPRWEERDRFILSKGQASPILYVALADRGFFPKDWLNKFAKGIDGKGKDAPFGVHLQCGVPGVEFTTGSLGHGLGYAIGVAEAGKIKKKKYNVFVLLGDGELYEGSNWECAMYANHNHINNLIAIVDRNEMCTNNYTEKIVQLEPLEEKWKEFGWEAKTIDGHSGKELHSALYGAKTCMGDKPKVIIAKTIKGRGIASMTDRLYMHGIAPHGREAEIARKELETFITEHERNGGYNDKER